MAYDIGQVRFLIIEDNPALATLFRSLLSGLAVRHIASAGNGETCKKIVIFFKPDIIITDYKMSPVMASALPNGSAQARKGQILTSPLS